MCDTYDIVYDIACLTNVLLYTAWIGCLDPAVTRFILLKCNLTQTIIFQLLNKI